ncbi:GLOBIN domain-containing protein [Aphelenchoides besseyi]|nr:GLOBIN domain-containing protein [Aphelenchoides besseyi]KAI6211724.1 GLOBIN domain-containing protein [Aphelenchoides besseyi]
MTQVPRTISKASSSSFDYDELATTEISRLTAERVQIIKESFALMKRHFTHNGLTVFIRLFSEYPLYKDLWPQFRAIPDSALMYSMELKKHVQVYCRGFNRIIDALDKQEELQKLFQSLAKLHSKKAIFKAHIMNMHTEFMVVLRSQGVENTEQINDSWFTLFDVLGNMVDPMKTEIRAI